MVYAPSDMSFREAFGHGIAAKHWHEQWRGHVTDVPVGEWPAMHSRWFPPGWALAPEHIELQPLPYQWALTVEPLPEGILTESLAQDTDGPSAAESIAGPEEWKLICGAVRRRAGHTCEVCGAGGASLLEGTRPEEQSAEDEQETERQATKVHEVWRFDELHKAVRLERLEALCGACHRAKHADRLADEEDFRETARHLAKVNEWDELHAELYLRQQLLRWRSRSRFEWSLDLSLFESDAYRRWLRAQRRRDSNAQNVSNARGRRCSSTGRSPRNSRPESSRLAGDGRDAGLSETIPMSSPELSPRSASSG